MIHSIKNIAIALSTVFMLSATVIPATVNTVEAGKLKKTLKKVKKGSKKGAAKAKWAAGKAKKGLKKGANAAHKGSRWSAGKVKEKIGK